MTSNSTPEPKTAPTGASAADSGASSDAPQVESTSKSAGKAKGAKKGKSKSRAGTEPNNVRKLRQVIARVKTIQREREISAATRS